MSAGAAAVPGIDPGAAVEGRAVSSRPEQNYVLLRIAEIYNYIYNYSCQWQWIMGNGYGVVYQGDRLGQDGTPYHLLHAGGVSIRGHGRTAGSLSPQRHYPLLHGHAPDGLAGSGRGVAASPSVAREGVHEPV